MLTSSSLLRDKPKKPYNYCGLTFIFSQPSRFDTTELLSGLCGQHVTYDILKPSGINKKQVDLRVSEDKSPLLPGTKVVVLFGQKALAEWTGNKYTVHEIRGTPLKLIGAPESITCLCTYSPVDTFDIVDHESRLNKHITDLQLEVQNNRISQELEEKRRHGKTARKNWRFFMRKDLEKAVRWLRDEYVILPEPNYIIYPDSASVINTLTNTKNRFLNLDIETDGHWNITCFAFSFHTDINVVTVPVLRYNYSLAYGTLNLAKIFRALAVAMRDNIVVSHNGKSFDWFILAYKYKLAIGPRVWDTMLAQNRIYPEAEKSLGHCVSLWLDEPFHKDEGVFQPQNPDQEQKLWRYCGKDVYTMAWIRAKQQAYASNDDGLMDSIDQVNECCKPYLTMEMTGINVDTDRIQSIMDYNDRLMNQYLRIMKVLMGPTVDFPLISSQKCAKYFHDMLDYPVLQRTKTGAPQLDETTLLKLKLKFPGNPVIDFLLAYRERKKETGSMKFKPMWKTLGELPEK